MNLEEGIEKEHVSKEAEEKAARLAKYDDIFASS